MNLTVKAATSLLLLYTIVGITSKNSDSSPVNITRVSTPNNATAPKIQAAILLDVSNSMDGLIEQAKAQLWNMISVMGKAKCNDAAPQIEIALYEYGSPRNDIAKGYVKQISPFTTDLDGLSKSLFGLTTNGGDEYCGQVIYTAIDELSWDTSSQSYKVIFIAGNEDFLQGKLHYIKACEAAKKKGILVNTIYCGDKMQGVREHWNLSGECGNGSYTNIIQNATIEDIPSPFDSSLVLLNAQLNGTYMAYNMQGYDAMARQEEVDNLNFRANKSAAMKRISVKGNKQLYTNANWDLIDASADSSFIMKLDKKDLPDSLKTKSKAELLQLVKGKRLQREAVQKQIAELSAKREGYLAEERKKRATNNQQTLETETEKLIIEQAKRFNMHIQ